MRPTDMIQLLHAQVERLKAEVADLREQLDRYEIPPHCGRCVGCGVVTAIKHDGKPTCARCLP